MIPLVVAVALTLAVQGWRRGAIVWIAVVAATFATIAGFKLVFLSCYPVFDPMAVHSPSGHVAAATVVSGGLAAMLTRRRGSILPAALAAALVIGFSRIVLKAHSLPEVIIGALVGLAGAAALMRFAGPPPNLRLSPLLVVIVTVAVLFHGLHLHAEAAIRRTAWRAGQFIPACRDTPENHGWPDMGTADHSDWPHPDTHPDWS